MSTISQETRLFGTLVIKPCPQALTGRRTTFSSLRLAGGLSGYQTVLRVPTTTLESVTAAHQSLLL